MVRNNKVEIYSSRLVSELKTFVWTGAKAQAQRGKNDDLVMALAIGLWLYDTSESFNKQSIDINQAMLQAMGVMSNAPKGILDPKLKTVSQINPFKPVILDEADMEDDDKKPYSFGWLLK